MIKDNDAKCDECGHSNRDHNNSGKCSKSFTKGRATFVCDCKVNNVRGYL